MKKNINNADNSVYSTTMSNLFNQFISAKYGNSFYEANDKIIGEFYHWLYNEYKNNLELYSYFLRTKMFLDVSDKSSIIEYGKSEFDSLLLGSSNTIISPYYFDNRHKDVVHKSVIVINGKPCLYDNKYEDLINLKIFDTTFVDRIITHNPYDASLIDEWSNLPKNSINILVSVFGNVNDLDIQEKLNLIDQLSNKLNNVFHVKKEVIINDTYFSSINTKVNCRKRV